MSSGSVLRRALDSMSQGLCMFDKDRRLIVCNRKYAELFRLPPSLVRPGTTLREIMAYRVRQEVFPVGDPETFIRDRMAVALSGKSARNDYEISDGRVLEIVHEPTADGGWVATFDDITERKRATEKIAYLAAHDPLTGLYNRKAFLDELAAAIARPGPPEPFALVCVDLDRFKDVNDVFGHAAGDSLLCEMADRLRNCHPGWFVARLGGDEFNVIVRDAIGPDQLRRLGRTIVDIGRRAVDVGGASVSVGISAGIAVYPRDGDTAEALIANADAALYRAKSDGRETYRLYEPGMDRRIRDKRLLQQELRAALALGQFRLHYQPQAEVGGRITGFEALMRWSHPTRGLVSPGTFIPLAEEIGCIGDLGEWALLQACAEAASWRNPLRVAVNVSALQLKGDDFPSIVHSVLLRTGLTPQRLELEVTESGLIDDADHANAILRRIKNLGIRIAMDDFGTGYSSLSSLHSFPFDRVKIDRSFVARLEEAGSGSAVVRSIIGLGRCLGLSVTAEGVETERQLELLASQECDEVQGYLIGRPQPIRAYAAIVQAPASPPSFAVAAPDEAVAPLRRKA